MGAISGILGQEIELISRFVLLLEQEQEALKKGQPTALPEIANEKSQLIDQLNRAEDQRNRALGAPYSSQGKAGMSAWLAANGENAKCSALWNKLLESAQQARHMHQLNAQLLALHINKTNEALAILTRHDTDNNTLYGSNGQTSPFTGSRIVDSA